jgi:hypothetical protein
MVGQILMAIGAIIASPLILINAVFPCTDSFFDWIWSIIL